MLARGTADARHGGGDEQMDSINGALLDTRLIQRAVFRPVNEAKLSSTESKQGCGGLEALLIQKGGPIKSRLESAVVWLVGLRLCWSRYSAS